MAIIAAVTGDTAAEKRLREKMAAQKRFVPWQEIVKRLERGEGTFIVNNGREHGRTWWIPRLVENDERYDAISQEGILTDCPWLMWSERAIQKKYPSVRVLSVTLARKVR